MSWCKHWHSLQFPLGICASRKCVRAVNQSLCSIAAKEGHPSHGIGKLASPFALVVDETLELLSDGGMCGKLSIRGKNNDVFAWLKRFSIEFDVPNTWCRILGFTDCVG